VTFLIVMLMLTFATGCSSTNRIRMNRVGPGTQLIKMTGVWASILVFSHAYPTDDARCLGFSCLESADILSEVSAFAAGSGINDN
jgi:hypothetical protein